MLKSNRKIISFKSLLVFLFTVLSASAQAGALEQLFAPEAKLQEVWLKHNGDSAEKINHKKWNSFLKNNIKHTGDGINRISYANVTKIDRSLLRAYIENMQKVKISEYNRNEQLAYWINLYNAVTVNVVLENYPVKSIRDIDISPGFFSDGPWGKKLVTVEKVALSLNDIEHGILRPIWKDPRIHYAVNCASVACPDLNDVAYTSSDIDAQLDLAAKKYIRHPRAVRMTKDGVIVSSIYSWFLKDFGEQEADVIKHIQKYATDDMVTKIEGVKFFEGDEYDWSLNDTAGTAP